MLSIDNPPPASDLTCRLPQIKTSSSFKSINGGDVEKPSSSSSFASSGKLVEKVDLPQAALGENNTNNSNPPPYFSIRDYVFSSRSKNIKTNWPFSEKSLELCLDHGVKELLPPFRSVGNLGRAVENTLADKQDNTIVLRDDQSTPCENDSLPPASHHTEPANINSSGTEGDKVYPCSDIDSVPASYKSSCLEFGTKAIGPDKVLSGKKSSSTAKLSNITEEENKTSNLVISESMASKTCPVCKNFSSSSNTTLNAHIDRCLSGEPKTVKWASSPNCEASKHRMRPRKTRLMTDIYATAQCCTLEDLDRRNGTTLAVRPNFSAPEMDECGDDNNEKSSPVDIEKSCDEGEVYIDANGTKLRILSKLSDGKGACSKKVMRGNKGSKFLSVNKKKKHQNKSQKYLKIMTSAAQNQNVCSRSPHISEKSGVQERSFVRKKITGKEQCPTQHTRSQDNNKMGNEHISNSHANHSCSSRNQNSSLESHKRLRDLECESSDDHDKQLYLKKKASFPMPDRYTVLIKSKKAKLSKAYDHPSAHYSGGIAKNDNPTVHSKPSIYGHHHAFSSKAKKFSSLRKLKGTVRSQVHCVPKSSADDKRYDSAEDQIDELQPTRDAKIAGILRTRNEECEKDRGQYIGRDDNNHDNSSTFSFGSVSSSGKSDDECDEIGPASELYARKKFMDFSKHGASGTDDDSLDLHVDHSRLFGDDEKFERPFICDQEEIFCDVGKNTGADEFQGGYCGHLEDDSIPIPGPPGSYIPSPGRTCSEGGGEEDLHQAAYSSLASSRLYQSSSEETSPVSATSTLSNFTRSSDKPASQNPWLYATMEDNKSSLSNDSIDHHHRHHTFSMMSCQDPPLLFQGQQPATADTTTPIPVKNSHLYKLSVDTDHHQVVNKVPVGRSESASPSSACKPVIRLMGKDVSVDPTDDMGSVSPQANNPLPPSQTGFVTNKPYFRARDPQLSFHKPHEDTNMNSNQRIWLHSSGYKVPLMSHGGVFRYNNDRRQLESFLE